MAQHLGLPMTKEQIYNAVWKEELLYSEHTITNTIYRLRKKLKRDVSSDILRKRTIKDVWHNNRDIGMISL